MTKQTLQSDFSTCLDEDLVDCKCGMCLVRLMDEWMPPDLRSSHSYSNTISSKHTLNTLLMSAVENMKTSSSLPSDL